MASAQQIIDKAREYLNTPFHHQGRVKWVGVDCVGLAICVARDLGIAVSDVDGYSTAPSQGLLESQLDLQLVKIDALEPGCIVLMRFDSDPQHLAIYTDSDTIIHATSAVGKVVEHGLNAMWRSKIVAFYKFRGV